LLRRLSQFCLWMFRFSVLFSFLAFSCNFCFLLCTRCFLCRSFFSFPLWLPPFPRFLARVPCGISLPLR
jgi:hypothetical protein